MSFQAIIRPVVFLCKVSDLPSLYIKTELCNTKTPLQHEDFIKLGGGGVFNWNNCISVLAAMDILDLTFVFLKLSQYILHSLPDGPLHMSFQQHNWAYKAHPVLTYYRNIAGYTQYGTIAIFCGAWNLKILSKHAFILSELNRNNPLLYKGTSLLLQRREVNNFTQGISALLRFKFGDSCFSTINLHMKSIIDMWITILIKTSNLLIVCGNTCFVQAGNCNHQ